MKKHILILVLFIGASLQAQSEEDVALEQNPDSRKEKSETSFVDRFSFNQGTLGNHNMSLGYNEYFRNYIDYNYKRIHFQLGTGLVTQKSFLNHMEPTIQVGMDAMLQYHLNKTFSLYVYGRYFSKPNNGGTLNSYTLDPFFLSSEIGAGIKGNFNNFQIDLGTRTSLDQTLNQAGPKTRLNTSFSLEF